MSSSASPSASLDQQNDIGAREFGARAADAFAFDGVGRFAQAGRVDQRQHDAVDVDRFAHEIARRAGNLGDDRALARGERIQKARFAGVRAADDDDVQSVGETNAAFGAVRAARRDRCARRRDRNASSGAERKSISSSGKSIAASIQTRRRTTAAVERAHASREFAVEAAQRGARGGFGPARDEIGDRFGLREVELAVEERAFGEFAGPRVARAELDETREQESQHDGAAVRVQLEHVFAGVRAAAP